MTGFDPMELPSVAAWREGFVHPPGFLDTLKQRIDGDGLALVAVLFQPRLLRIRGCVLLPWAYDADAFDAWWRELDGDVFRIECVLNHLHLWDVVNDDLPDEALRYMGESLVQSWRAALAWQVPEREFNVAFVDGPEDYGPTVTIQSIRR